MAKRKRAKRETIRNLEYMGEPLYDLDFEKIRRPETVSDSSRTAGPPEAAGVRTDGDPALAAVLSRALSHSGRVERDTHGFHTYPAGMHPDCAADILDICPGKVHDPFCGGGTVVVEAMLAHRQASGTDLSPIAHLVSRARTASAELATPVRAAARRIVEAAQEAGTDTQLEVPEIALDWYEPHVAQEIALLRQGILQEDVALRPYLNAILSAILIKSSFRESDTSNQRVVSERPPGTTLTLFHKKARLYGRMLEGMAADLPRPVLTRGDAREVPPPRPVDLILTSPPYPGVYDYLPMQQLRYAWLNIPAGPDMAREIGSRRDFRAKGRTDALAAWVKDTRAWIRTQVQGLSDGGRLAIIVGDGLVAGRAVDTLSPTVEAIESTGLYILARASADRPDHAREEIRTEHLILAEKM